MKIEALTAGGLVLLLAMAAAEEAVAAARTSVPLHSGWTFHQVGREESYPAKVPGVVHLDLFDTLARHVRLAYAPDDGFFADNYFDLVPGRPVQVLYRQKDGVELEAFRKGLEIVSIVDAF